MLGYAHDTRRSSKLECPSPHTRTAYTYIPFTHTYPFQGREGGPHKTKAHEPRQTATATGIFGSWIWACQCPRSSSHHACNSLITPVRPCPRAGESLCPPLSCSLAVFLSPARHTRRSMPPQGLLPEKTTNVAQATTTHRLHCCSQPCR